MLPEAAGGQQREMLRACTRGELGATPSWAAVLSSRRGRRLRPGEPWVRETDLAVGHILAEGRGLVTGLGMWHYDVAAWAALRRGGPVWVLLPGALPVSGSSSAGDAWITRYRWFLAASRVSSCSDLRFSAWRTPAARQARDRAVVENAERLLLIRGRPRGNMLRLAAEALERGAELSICRFGGRWDRVWTPLIEHGASFLDLPAVGQPPPPGLADQGPSGRLPAREWPGGRAALEWIYHFTRAAPQGWPGARLEQRIAAVFEAHADAAHSAFDTLCRILSERRLRASGRLIRGGRAVVCFTAAPPERILELVQWQRHLLRWRFEPYCIALRRDYAERKGIRPVIYAAPGEYERLAPEQRHLYQRHEPPQVDWSAEEEWRHVGDLDLDDARPGEIAALAPTAEEASSITRAHGIPAYVAFASQTE